MALTVEDGTVVAGAESYLSVADADTYWTEHGSPADWTGATTANKEAALRYATKWLDQNFKWYSCIVDSDQVLLWPRVEYKDTEGRSIGGNTIPQSLKDATAEMALAWLQNNFAEAKQSNVRRIRIGQSEEEYRGGGSNKRSYKYATLLVNELGTPRNSALKLERN